MLPPKNVSVTWARIFIYFFNSMSAASSAAATPETLVERMNWIGDSGSLFCTSMYVQKCKDVCVHALLLGTRVADKKPGFFQSPLHRSVREMVFHTSA